MQSRARPGAPGCNSGVVRWQPFAVGAALLAPPVLLAAVVWPDDGIGIGGGGDGGVEAELGAGDSDTATTNGFTSTDFLILGPGQLRVSVDGPDFDPTLTILDVDSGQQLGYNDDFDNLNPSLVVDLGDGESVRAQVRSLGGPPGGRFEISVQETGDLPDVGGAVDGGRGDDGGGVIGGPLPVDLDPVDLGELDAGSSAGATTGNGTLATYRLAGPGDFVVGVDGPSFDPTLRVVDDDDGTEIAYNDDAGGSLNPSVVFSLADGQTARLEVGVFGGGGGDFTITVSSPDGSVPTTIVVPLAPPETAPPPLLP